MKNKKYDLLRIIFFLGYRFKIIVGAIVFIVCSLFIYLLKIQGILVPVIYFSAIIGCIIFFYVLLISVKRDLKKMENKKEVGYICACCGNTVPYSEVKGSAKYPLCTECFEMMFKGDYDLYFERLNTRKLF